MESLFIQLSDVKLSLMTGFWSRVTYFDLVLNKHFLLSMLKTVTLLNIFVETDFFQV